MKTILFLLIAIGMVGCGSDDSGNDNQTPDPNPIENPQKSKLLSNLQQIQNSSKILIGHQGTNIAGVGWRLNNFPNGIKAILKMFLEKHLLYLVGKLLQTTNHSPLHSMG